MSEFAELVGMSEAEVREVASDQSVSSMPSRYVEFLRLMGKAAGALLVGTDAFYPGILGLKRDGLELVTGSGLDGLVPSDVIVFAMHQGYQVYWMSSELSDDPPVYMYQEGDKGVSREWKSFTDFLRYELSKTV
ncbi:SMI1/KNR4 family protein [Micromonospora sp. KC207]|uniref:SMI1/KNR4 family protein n=1 Tax=Micromonospora sp. KC207 TaxID=2530377 RepID=UPI001052A4F8|nr:SMI1/KNR4 family protein [Micromonospora sp. KC207]TDC63718.1 SMI1/KNR4 family protein [Micromonospora sp. KC207]